MDTQLSHRQAKGMFLDFADAELPPEQQRRLEAHLEGCQDCRAGWQRYSATVLEVQRVERERAPAHLSTLVMRRVRRRRNQPSRLAPHQLLTAYRVPVEALVPVLLGVAVAAFLVLAAP